MYNTIVCDPPWRYKTTLPGFKTDRLNRSAVPYPTMANAEIAALDVRSLAAKDAHLYLWTTNTHLPYAFEIAKGWGVRVFHAADLEQAASRVRRVPDV